MLFGARRDCSSTDSWSRPGSTCARSLPQDLVAVHRRATYPARCQSLLSCHVKHTAGASVVVIHLAGQFAEA